MSTSAFAEYDGRRLTVGNELIRREWSVDGARLTPVSIGGAAGLDRTTQTSSISRVATQRGPRRVASRLWRKTSALAVEWVDVDGPDPAAAAAGRGGWGVERLEVHDDDLDGAAERHLRADLVLRWDAGADTGGAGGAGGSAGFRGQFRGQFRGRVVRRFRVWADWPVVLQSVVVEPGEPGEPGGGGDGEGDPGGEEDGAEGVGAWDVWLGGGLGGGLDGWALPGGVRAWESVALLGRSDHRDNLVELARGVLFEKETVERRGHLLHLTRWDGSAGLAAMKLAPPPDEQLPGVAEEPGEAGDGGPGRNLRGDFRVAGRALSIRGSGLSAGEIGGGGAAGEAIESYVSGVGLTDGTCGGAAALLRGTLRRLARPRIPERGVAMSNNWGGGGSVGVLSEAFVLAELDAAAVMGLTQVQVDAGWHRGDARALHVEQLEPGSTSATDPDFWAVHPERFPRGLAPIRDRARELGLNWGLWYCLDRADDYTRWRDDLATLLGLWREYGVTHFKFDGVAFTTRLGEMRVRRLLADLYRQTGGQVAASIDITGSKSRRLGLTSGVTHVRDHFVENRYTGNATYRPHRTLRNLWQLARYVPTCRLEMEWLNVHRHPENYRDDPLAPAAFGVEYALAVTLMALPLAWMHLQALPPADAAAARRVLQAVRPHQRAMLHGDVQPIGDEPSGAAWTGFLSTPPDQFPEVPPEAPPTGYLLLFREVNEDPAHRFTLPGLPPGATLELEPIVGDGPDRTVTLDDTSSGRFHLPEPRSYALYRWRLGGNDAR